MLFVFILCICVFACDCLHLKNVRNLNSKFRSFKSLSSSDNGVSVIDKILPKVPSTAWRWPPSWPFPDDFQSNTTTFSKKPLSPTSLDSLTSHLSQFIKSDSSVLEIGTASYSVLPNIALNLSRKKISFSEIQEEANVNREFYDCVIVTSGVESIVDPRNFFKQVWNLIKPGGSCNICFTSEPCDEVDLSIKMWTTMTEEQKIWIAGSYFQYSVTGGWVGIEGYDIFEELPQQLVFNKREKGDDSYYVVRAEKISFPDLTNENQTINWINSQLQSSENMELSDIPFLSLRMVKFAESLNSMADNVCTKLIERISIYSKIYNVLKEVNEAVIPRSILAMLAEQLSDKWRNTESQIMLLRRGLSLETADEDFWTPIGNLTSTLKPREKILLLADLVNNWDNINLNNIPAVLEKILASLESKETSSKREIIESLAVEFAIVEYLNANTSLDRIVRYIQETDADVLTSKLNRR